MNTQHSLIPPAGLFVLAVALVAAVPPAEVRPGSREFDDQGYHVRLDLAPQVLGIEIPEDRGFGDREAMEPPISPTLAVSGSGFVSGSMLAQKAKQFDDGLYAAVELAAQNGAGRFRGKAAMLQSVARALSNGGRMPAGEPPMLILAACRLGKVPAAVPRGAEASVEAMVRGFLAQELRSKPIGFYTWSPALEDIFRQDRILQSELKGKAGVEALARALRSVPEARATYSAYEALVSRLTNPLKVPNLAATLEAIDQGRTDIPERGIAFLPPSRAHETDLIMRLYGNQPIPDGFNLADEMIRRIRAGQLDLRPSPTSGWYDYQTWALEPLVRPERTSEASHLEMGETYRKQLIELFKGILALTRETHIKQLDIPRAAAPVGPVERPVIIRVAPELSAEPLATYYLRRGQGYRFIRSVLDLTFGSEALRGLHRLTASGPVQADLASELDQVQSLFLGASATVTGQLGLAPLPDEAARPGGTNGASASAAFRRWAGALASDPDLGRDARMMVPVFFDRKRGMTKVWAFLGWTERPVRIWFATPPTAEVTRDGRTVGSPKVEVQFDSTGYRLAYPVTAEVYVTRILNRDEFRKHCDRYKTRSMILKNLR